MTLEEKRQEVWDKITNLYSKNIQIIPPDESEPQDVNGGTTQGFISRLFANIIGTKTDARGRTIYIGTLR